MSDKVTKTSTSVEAQPLKPLPMPEYGFQREYPSGFGSTAQVKPEKAQTKNLDLSGVVLNLSH